MSHIQETTDHLLSRRSFFGRTLWGVGASAMASMMPSRLLGSPLNASFAPRAKRVIYLFMSGAPSQIDLCDHKPRMQDLFDKDLPDSVRQGHRLTTMTSGQRRFPLAQSMSQFGGHDPSRPRRLG